jgi:hypothetical protein
MRDEDALIIELNVEPIAPYSAVDIREHLYAEVKSVTEKADLTDFLDDGRIRLSEVRMLPIGDLETIKLYLEIVQLSMEIVTPLIAALVYGLKKYGLVGKPKAMKSGEEVPLD